VKIIFNTDGTGLQVLDQANQLLYSLICFPEQNDIASETLEIYRIASVFLIR
jgi:hypothetical protein